MERAANTKRRDFLKSAGGIAVAFSWSMPTVLAQQAARPDSSRQPRHQPHAGRLGPHQRRPARSPCSPASASWARAS